MAFAQRRTVAESLRRHRNRVAEQVTEEFLHRHPDWLVKYGETARVRGIEDARFHVDFLAGAVESGAEQTFVDYAQWAARVLAARGIAGHFLTENLAQIGDHVAALLDREGGAVVRRYIDAARPAIAAPPAAVSGTGDADLAPQRSVYTQAILNGDRRAALAVAVEMLRAGHAVQDIYCDVLQPAQYELGRLWERNEITVAREHMATAITQFVIAQLYSKFEQPDVLRGRAIVTGVEGELHQLGANMVADILEADGWDVRFLGTQSPRRDVIRAIDEHAPAVLGVSATMLFNVSHAAALIEDARARFGDLRIVVGGGAFRGQPELWREIGADGYSVDLRSAVAAVRTLTGAG